MQGFPNLFNQETFFFPLEARVLTNPLKETLSSSLSPCTLHLKFYELPLQLEVDNMANFLKV